MILRLIYVIMAVVIVILVINLLKLSDKVDTLKKNEEYWFKEYLREKQENEENKKIIETIKDNLPF